MTLLPSLAALRSAAGLMRSLAIYHGRPWRLAAQARFYAGFMGPGDVVFDIGAHVGNRSLAMARTGARVVALEPQALFHGLLTRIMPATVTVLPLAAGAAAKPGVLAISRRHPTVSSLAPGFRDAVGRTEGFRHVAWDASQPVEITTLDALIAAHGLPAFIKIDVEGHEAEVLAGLGRPVPALAFEFLPQALDVARAAIDRLAALGTYEFNVIRGERLDFALSRWQTGSDVMAFLQQSASEGRSGDIYARLAGHFGAKDHGNERCRAP